MCVLTLDGTALTVLLYLSCELRRHVMYRTLNNRHLRREMNSNERSANRTQYPPKSEAFHCSFKRHLLISPVSAYSSRLKGAHIDVFRGLPMSLTTSLPLCV